MQDNKDAVGNANVSYLQPAIILTVLTAETYIIGWRFVIGYFSRLGLEYKSLDLTPISYLTAATPPIISILLIIAAAILLGTFRTSDTWPVIVASNFPFVAFALIVAQKAQTLYPSPNSYFWLFLASLSILAYFYFSFRRQPFFVGWWRGPLWRGALVVIVMFFMTYLASGIIGEQNAVSLVEKGFETTITVEFKWKNNPPIELQGKELILIIHRDGKYFVIPYEKPAPIHPNSYIIPDDEIEYAISKRSD